jgi:Double zinc ribbon
MSNEGTLRIFCPTHEAVFEAPQSPKLLCEITGHALAIDFPGGEFWEFCCNCETFAPSRLDKNEKARKTCYGCDNEIARRFVCGACNLISFESESLSKGKRYSVNATKGVDPCCAGCGAAPSSQVFIHDCREAAAIFATTRTTCPFCREKTAHVAAAMPQAVVGTGSLRSGSVVCDNCGAANPSTSAFCGQCRHQLRSDTTVATLGTDVNKTKLLGSLCPTCGTPVPHESVFCGECGQAVKKSIVVPPPPPPPPRSVSPFTSQKITDDLTGKLPPSLLKSPAAKAKTSIGLVVGIGAVVALIILVAIAANVPKTSVTTSSSSTFTPSPTVNTPRTQPSVDSSGNYSSASTSDSELPTSFTKDFSGTIGGKTFSMALTRSGDSLRGTASTNASKDVVSGSIKTDGNFTMKGYHDGKFTGIYSGTFSSNGTSVTGKWTTTSGDKGTSFTLSES